MNKATIAIAIAITLLLTGCGPSNEEYNELLRKINSLELQVEANNKEIRKLNQTPGILLAKAEKTKTANEKIKILNKIIEIYPNSEEAKKATEMLNTAKVAEIKSRASYQNQISLSKSCDVNGDRLPINFKGTNIPAIIDIYESAKIAPKSNFETSIEHKSRVSNEVKKIGFNLQCAVIDAGAVYDADRESWVVGLPSYITKVSGHQTYIITTYKIVSSENYVGTNSFGVSKEIYKKTTLSKGVALPSSSLERNILSLGERSDQYSNDTLLKMKRDIAKSIDRNDIKYVIQYKWTPDYVTGFNETRQATISHPQESNNEYKAITGKVLNIFIFNEKTGEILKKTNNKID